MASTAIGMSPWPVMKTMGTGACQFQQAFLQFQAAHARHSDVENQAPGAGRVVGVEKVPGTGEGLAGEVHGVQEHGNGVADRLVIVHDKNGRLFWQLIEGLYGQGEVKSGSGVFVVPKAQHPAMLRDDGRQIDRPMPMPSLFVV